MTLTASIHVVAHATEDVTKIINRMYDVLSIPMEKFLVSRARGHWGNEISVISGDFENRESYSLLEMIIANLKLGEKNYLLNSISDSFDEKDNFYIRLNKQSICKGVISLSEHDSIRIRFKPIREFNQNNKFKDHVMNLFTKK